MEKVKIILVEDNQQFRESIKELLIIKYCYEVIAEANNGEEFLSLGESLSPDIILMDLSMPNINGFEATKKYFWQFPKSKIIAVTGSIETTFLDKLIEVGFKGCVFKHNVFDEIQKAIETVLSDKMWFLNVHKLSFENK